jgi:hypothetical protein
VYYRSCEELEPRNYTLELEEPLSLSFSSKARQLCSKSSRKTGHEARTLRILGEDLTPNPGVLVDLGLITAICSVLLAAIFALHGFWLSLF